MIPDRPYVLGLERRLWTDHPTGIPGPRRTAEEIELRHGSPPSCDPAPCPSYSSSRAPTGARQKPPLDLLQKLAVQMAGQPARTTVRGPCESPVSGLRPNG